MHLLYGCRTSDPENSGQQCVPEHWKVSRHLRLSLPGAWVSPSPSLGLSEGLVGLLSKSTGSKARGCLTLRPWPWHSAGPGWVPCGSSVDTGQGNGWGWGSLGVSAHIGSRSQVTRLPALFLEIGTWIIHFCESCLFQTVFIPSSYLINNLTK